MARMVVGTFNSRADADAARRRLLEQGYDDTHIRVEGGETRSSSSTGEHAGEPRSARIQDRGLAGVITRMFSGLLTESDEIARYARAVSHGKSVLALQVHDDAAASAESILHEIVAAATTPGPETYPLPNSPTGWDETIRGERSAIDILIDPGRPNGLVSDAHGLGTDDFQGRSD